MPLNISAKYHYKIIVLKEWSATILNISALAVDFHSWISHVTLVALSHCIALLKSEDVRKNLKFISNV